MKSIKILIEVDDNSPVIYQATHATLNDKRDVIKHAMTRLKEMYSDIMIAKREDDIDHKIARIVIDYFKQKVDEGDARFFYQRCKETDSEFGSSFDKALERTCHFLELSYSELSNLISAEQQRHIENLFDNKE